MQRTTVRIPVLLSAALLLSAAAGRARPARSQEGGVRRLEVAVIVHPQNDVQGMELGELRSYFKMERQFWPDRRRCDLYLRPSKSPEMRLMLELVYRMRRSEMRKYWVEKLFRGEIPSKPIVVATAEKAIEQVRRDRGAISIVLADEVPDGVRVLAIDGKRPGEAGYPLGGQFRSPDA